MLAASTIRDLSLGKSAGFRNVGEVAFKGFPEPVRLVEVLEG